MVNINNLIDLQLEIFVLMIIGYILRRFNIISAQARGGLNNLVIYVVLPANIIYSFMGNASTQLISGGLLIFIVSIIVQLLCQVFGKYFFNFKSIDHDQSNVLKYGTICSNAGFMGSPLIQGLYGLNGLMYASIYLIPMRVVMWSGGVACFLGEKGKNVVKRVMVHPCIIAVEIGIIIMLFKIRIPGFVAIQIEALSNCTMALSMIVIGGILAEIDIRKVFNKLTLYFSFIRLILIPLLVMAGCLIFRLPSLVSAVSVVLAGMPAGATTAILAEKYHGDSALAVAIIFVSTLFSLISVPVLCIILNNFL